MSRAGTGESPGQIALLGTNRPLLARSRGEQSLSRHPRQIELRAARSADLPLHLAITPPLQQEATTPRYHPDLSQRRRDQQFTEPIPDVLLDPGSLPVSRHPSGE